MFGKIGVEVDLKKATKDWTVPVIVRTYETDKKGQKNLQLEAEVLGEHGYVPATQSEDGGHIHTGRILLTGGLSVLAGRRGIRSKGKITINFQKVPDQRSSGDDEPEPVQEDVADQIRKLAALRDEGLLTEEEFASKKKELLGI